MNTVERVLLGCALGDSLGLPYEGLKRKKVSRLLDKNLRHSLFFGKGMLSDDTEHSVFVVRSYENSSTADEYSAKMRSHLRKWLLCLPPGIGLGTLKSIIKMWLGFKKSGVRTAGNGPLMRTAILAALLENSPEKLDDSIKANTYLTHTDERAYETALVLARLVLINIAKKSLSVDDLKVSSEGIKNQEFKEELKSMLEALEANKTPDEYVIERGWEKGISGYCLHTFCVAVYAVIYFKNDIEKIIHWTILCGGDTDSVAAVAGALAAASPDCQLPEHLINKISDWPFSVKYMQTISGSANFLKFPFFKMALRNLFFIPLILVLALVRIFR
ncbi:MAG: ADP-ribosylglycohydrolase family protein [Lentisphaeraceae bacterium]|nr:ADP-ribosylglycohydrolase family protein [Lentisphaeraceae bacterium]